MNEIIPLKKDIIFKTRIGEITNITLDYDYKIDSDMVIGGVDVSGSYKMTEASINSEDFLYTIPFSIALTKKIKEESLKLEIDDFKYKYDRDVLSVKVDLLLSCDEVEEEVFNMQEFFDNEVEVNDNKVDDFIDLNSTNINDNVVEINNDKIENNVSINEFSNITNNIINEEKKYYKYKVYIVRANDTVDSICDKYNVNINDIKEYNDVTNINVGDKIIIPYINEYI